MTTLIEIVQAAADEIAIDRPSSVIANSDRDVRRLLRFSNIEGKELARDYDWTVLDILHSFTTVASQEEYDLPSDYDRLIRNTEYDRSSYWPLWGPLSPSQWQAIKSSQIGSGIVGRRYRILRSALSTDRTLRIDPTPTTSGDTLVFEYISANWCAASDGTPQSEWAADDDVTLMDERLMTLGLVIRYKRAVGLDYASEADEYAQVLSRTRAQDRPSPDLNLTPRGMPQFLGPWSLPETGYGA